MSSRICPFYVRGACWFGIRCWNSHDRSILMPSSGSSYSSDVSNEQREQSTFEVATSGNSDSLTNDQVMYDVAQKPENTTNGTTEVCEARKVENDEQNQNEYPIVMSDGLYRAIDRDLQCNICYETFIKPTVLNCSHTFCESCINNWTRRVKKCPICRVRIKSKAYCLTLDIFLEKIFHSMSTEVKEKRASMIKERNKAIAQANNNVNRSGRSMRSLDYSIEDDSDEIDADILINAAEMMRMNLHDTVVSTRGRNPLNQYMNPGEDIETIIQRCINSFNVLG